MKKLIFLFLSIFLFFACGSDKDVELERLLELAEQSEAKWSSYDEMTAGTLTDDDDFLVRDISDTPPTTGIQKRLKFSSLVDDLITVGFFNGSVAIVKVITEPDNLSDMDFQPIWVNESNLTFTITEIHAKCETADFDFTLKKCSGTNFSSLTTIEAVTVSTAGTSIYTYTLTTGIDSPIIDDGYVIGYDASADVADYVVITLVGEYS